MACSDPTVPASALKSPDVFNVFCRAAPWLSSSTGMNQVSFDSDTVEAANGTQRGTAVPPIESAMAGNR